jgi:glutaredoxin
MISRGRWRPRTPSAPAPPSSSSAGQSSRRPIRERRHRRSPTEPRPVAGNERSAMRLTIYSKPGCHLCDEMKAVVERVVNHKGSRHVELEIVDISRDAELEARYGLEIPVLMIDGKKAAKFRIAEDDLNRRLTSRYLPRPRTPGAPCRAEYERTSDPSSRAS